MECFKIRRVDFTVCTQLLLLLTAYYKLPTFILAYLSYIRAYKQSFLIDLLLTVWLNL